VARLQPEISRSSLTGSRAAHHVEDSGPIAVKVIDLSDLYPAGEEAAGEDGHHRSEERTDPVNPPGGTNSFLFHPQRLGRAALFQLHLWIGLILGIYVCAVSINGWIVVLEEELTRLSRPELFRLGSKGQPTR
jgi:hypothetical protein